ncbi:hypothetical protein ScPMuIL_015203 [Solemya velum]
MEAEKFGVSQGGVLQAIFKHQQRHHGTSSTPTNQSKSKTFQEKQVEEQLARNKDAGLLTELIRDFLDPAEFYQAIRRSGIDFFCGVPDSLLKDFCAYVTKNAPEGSNVITANEGNAVGLAAGYHLATGKTAMVYLQNSGLGNIINPVMSLAAPPVFSIPMLLLIGWRGEPGKRDEPQHMVQGQATPGLLAALGIPFQPLPDYEEGAEQALQTAKHYMDSTKGPYAFLVKRQTFLPYKLPRDNSAGYPLTREKAMQVLVRCLNNRDVIISSTGMLSRELYEYRVSQDMGHERDFLTVGSMGHASAIALGVAMKKPKRMVFCLDGDGAVIMHMGAMASIGQNGPTNFKHVIFNNGCHDSVGGQPTDASKNGFNFIRIAEGCGYKQAFVISQEEEIEAGVARMKESDGPVLMEIKISSGSRKNLGRPSRLLQENRDDFMHFLAIG